MRVLLPVFPHRFRNRYDSFHWKCHPLQKPGKINFGNRGRHVHCDTSHCAPGRDGRSTNARGGVLQSRRSRRAHAEARAPMRGSSRVCRGVWRSRRCPARCAALRGAARRRGAPAARGCWVQRPRLGGGAGAGHQQPAVAQQPAAAQLLRAAGHQPALRAAATGWSAPWRLSGMGLRKCLEKKYRDGFGT